MLCTAHGAVTDVGPCGALDAALHRAVHGCGPSRQDQVPTNLTVAADVRGASSEEQVFADLAAEREPAASDAGVALDRAVDHQGAGPDDQVATYRATDAHVTAHRHQVAVDSAVDGDGAGDEVEVTLDVLVCRHCDGAIRAQLAVQQVLAHRDACGKREESHERDKGDADAKQPGHAAMLRAPCSRCTQSLRIFMNLSSNPVRLERYTEQRYGPCHSAGTTATGR